MRDLAPLVTMLLAVLLAASGCGAGSHAQPSNGAAQPSTRLVLTSPPPQPPAGLADPDTPAYDPDTGFTPDAKRVLTVISLQLSLERYKSVQGSYPRGLAELFPQYAPLDEEGKPMTAPPTPAEAYSYEGSSSEFTLSVVLASGQSFSVSSSPKP